MSVDAKTTYKIKKYLQNNMGIVLPFDKREHHEDLDLPVGVIQTAMKKFISFKMVECYGNWRHAWYFLTESGHKTLTEEIGLPEEARIREENIIKN
ncbi:hypothetical protein A0H76_1790 [Hepatospora eriocheir]|uniref:Plectin/eS10 N-terminal domain-containing protein n=1 Tax=Hepatospora eriocheir TaxID=1081669 RepID=A0A1X0QKH3_9MICR|nr:hypothetical protein A0H76_1790 [Hepatospora eriocheir]